MTDAHLDDLSLSAILDGEDVPSTHLANCAPCRARFQEFETVARLVGGSVTPPADAVRDAAIASALAAHRPQRARSRLRAAAFATAALVLAIAALIPVLVSRDDGSDRAATSRASAPTSKMAAGTSGSATDSAAAIAIRAGDLGPVNADLRERVIAALRAGPTAAASSDQPIACDSELRSLDPKVGALLLYGEATVNQQRGYVLVYTTTDSEPPKLAAYVVAQSNCRSILDFASFTAPDAGGASTGPR